MRLHQHIYRPSPVFIPSRLCVRPQKLPSRGVTRLADPIPPQQNKIGVAPFSSNDEFTRLNSRSEKRSVFNKGEAYFTGPKSADPKLKSVKNEDLTLMLC